MYEPPFIEMLLTNLLGKTLIHPYYAKFVRELYLNGNEVMLDFCCGSGIIARELAKKLPQGRLVCADVSRKWLQNTYNKVKDLGAVLAYLEDLKENDLFTQKFDKAIIHYALHDFSTDSRLKALKLIQYNMKPGGLVVIREPTVAGHGIQLYQMINLLEQLKITDYTYSQRYSGLIGNHLDVRITVDA